MASYEGKTDISSTNPYPLGLARTLCHGTDITFHVPCTGVHLTATMAREIANALMDAAQVADSNRNNIGL